MLNFERKGLSFSMLFVKFLVCVVFEKFSYSVQVI